MQISKCMYAKFQIELYTYLVYFNYLPIYTTYTLMKMAVDFFVASTMRSSLYFSHKHRINQKAQKKGGLQRHMRLSNNLANWIHCPLCVFVIWVCVCWGSQLVGVGSDSPAETACKHHIQCLSCPTKTHINTHASKHVHTQMAPCGEELQPSHHGVRPLCLHIT